MRAEKTDMWTGELTGFRREDGSVGIRNLVVVLAAADNANPFARKLADLAPGVVYLPASYGRGQLGEDFDISVDAMAGLAVHPNVAGALVVSFEPESSIRIAEAASKRGRQVENMSLLEASGLTPALKRGHEMLQRLQIAASRLQRSTMKVDELVIGLECGGSDTTSGLIGNPSLGAFVDHLIDVGGTAIFSEPLECIGCEEMLRKRAVSDQVAADILTAIDRYKEIAGSHSINLTGTNPTPDNIKGGLTTIEEKSLGAVAKSGTKPIRGVLRYGQRPPDRGLWFIDAPAAAVENITALAAGGCQSIVFVTGSANPVGHPISPTIKVCANPITIKRMAEHIDLDLSEGLMGHSSILENSKRIANFLWETVNGAEVAAERLGYLETNISRFGESV